MKYVSTKTWPWPVLRHDSDDYGRCEFQVEITPRMVEGSTGVTFEADFALSDRAILDEVAKRKACYSLLISCSSTHYRDHRNSYDPRIVWPLGNGVLADRVEVTPFVVTTKEVVDFVSDNWHEDYEGMTFSLAAGAVLAMEAPYGYWIQTGDESPARTVFKTEEDDKQSPNEWTCDLNGDYVILRFNPEDYHRFKRARSRAVADGTAEYIMNGVYLPALVCVLSEVDRDADGYSHLRWFSALSDALARAGCSPIGSAGDLRRGVDAQKILNAPFGRMPFLADREDTS
ncbi:MAG: hypothetical protein F4029_03030 [Gammaproteobacteria bacterium]|nr:hypothetical protein [Gammaproteobacteria bacterium]MYF30698.1 hypothetical protein [Gammaproteobacteria bacterium]MYK45183.1 hypothetical protein [Gammaproteobacteria bacterium]